MPAELLNAEAIVGSYLREHADLKALKARVLGQTPSTTDKPWVRITQQDLRNVTGTRKAEHLVAYWLQLDCYAGAKGGQPEAQALNAAVRAALVAITDASLAGAVATDVEFLSNPRIADDDFEPARERFVLDAEIYMHPQ
jgi:hypothetical protein